MVPFFSIAAQKTAVVCTVLASNTFIDYTIQVSNVGSGVRITDKLDAAVRYFANSFVYMVGGNVESVTAADFPLTGAGLANPAAFNARGGQHTMTFTLRVIDTSVDLIYNGGDLFRKFRAVLLGHCHVKTLTRSPLPPSEERVENPILEKVRSGGSGQTFALPTKKKVSEQMEIASVPTYASVLKKGLKLAPVAVHSF